MTELSQQDITLSDPRDWVLPDSRGYGLACGSPLSDAIDHFRDNPATRILPVVDDGGFVIGAIFEEEVRRLLFNPYGHALLQNPEYGRRLDALMRACPMAEIGSPIDRLLDIYAQATTDEGMILTRDGRPAGIVSNRMLVRMAAAWEGQRTAAQIARLEQLTTAGARFERDAGVLADLLTRIGGDMFDAAGTAAGHANRSADRVATMTESLERSHRTIDLLVNRTHALADALGRLRNESAGARETAVRAVTVSTLATTRTTQLATAARSIEAMLDLIQAVAGKVSLLSLNATIEAARAGEAGRGFAVVAGEVKTLAGRTRQAAAEIGSQVEQILVTVDEVAQDQAMIGDVVATIDMLTGSVDAAVAVQRGVTDHVAQSAEAARDASEAMAAIFGDVRHETRGSLDQSGHMQGMAQDLNQNAARLRGAVSAFLTEMRMADPLPSIH